MKRLPRETLKKYKEEFTRVLRDTAKSPELFQEALIDFYTPGEYDELAIRWQIVKLLSRGESHREIADKLKIGIGTVARGSRELRNPKGGFNLILKGNKGKS